MPGPNGERCADCNAWDYQDQKLGICRAYPPKPVIVEATGKTMQVMWPQTAYDDWCKKSFRKKLDEQVDGVHF